MLTVIGSLEIGGRKRWVLLLTLVYI